MEWDQPQTVGMWVARCQQRKAAKKEIEGDVHTQSWYIVFIDCIFRARIEVMFILQRVHIQNVQHLHLSGADMGNTGEDDVIEEEEEVSQTKLGITQVKEKND